MRVKLMMHYALSFFIACLLIVLINIFYMRSYVYKEADLYSFDATPLFNQIELGLELKDPVTIGMSDQLVDFLKEQSIGLQIVDDSLVEVLRVNVTHELSLSYAPASLVRLYENEDVTVFIEPLILEQQQFTVLMFLDASKIKRTLYTYDVAQVGAAYNVYWLIGMNLMVLLMFSYMYTYSISRPIHRIIERIMSLVQGNYESSEPGKDVYATVDKAMNQLACQLEKAQVESEQAEITREEWISNLSHDIKTPLTSIMGYGELLGDIEYPLSSEERLNYAHVIHTKGNYIQSLVADLNLSTRLKHHSLGLKAEPSNIVLEIKSVLIDVLNSTHLMYSDHKVAFTYTQEEVMVALDRHLFKRVLLNLVHNAFVHNEGAIMVKVHVDATAKEWVSIMIEDNGIGVKEDDLKRIFTRYYRGTHTRTKSEGTGLGLAIAYDIVLAHEGYLNAEHSPLGGLRLILKLRRFYNETLS